jgi:hypothetical protein
LGGAVSARAESNAVREALNALVLDCLVLGDSDTDVRTKAPSDDVLATALEVLNGDA